MNYPRLGLAALAGTVASFAFGFLVMALWPGLFEEGRKFAGVFRPEEEMMAVMPIALAAAFLGILLAAVLFAKMHPRGSGAREGARFGVLLGLFVVFAFVLHNYANLNIGLKFALEQAAVYFLQWTVVGTVIGLVYRPLAAP